MQSAARATLLTALQQYFSIPREEAALVLDEFEPSVCRGGHRLFRQGDAADCLYLLARGRMQVWLGQSSGEREERLVAEVNPGETIGEIGMLTPLSMREAGALPMRAHTAVERHPRRRRGLRPGRARRRRLRPTSPLHGVAPNSLRRCRCC